jgi:hypothetical protein
MADRTRTKNPYFKTRRSRKRKAKDPPLYRDVGYTYFIPRVLIVNLYLVLTEVEIALNMFIAIVVIVTVRLTSVK